MNTKKKPLKGTLHSEKVDLHFDLYDLELITYLSLKCHSCPPTWGMTMDMKCTFSPVELCEPVSPFLSLFFLEEVLVVLARLGTKSFVCKRSSAKIFLVPGHAAGSGCDCLHVRLLRSVPSYQ